VAGDGGEIGRLGGDGAMLLDHDGGRLAHLRFAVRRGQEKAQPCGAFGNGRIENRLHVDAAREQRLREPAGPYRAAGNHRDDRRPDRAARIEAAGPDEIEEQPGPLVEPANPLRLAFEDFDGRARFA
jgi:hypothetical protein